MDCGPLPLGAYGNAWYATPALDALAAESLVFDWMWCDSPELAGFYRSVWGQGATLLSQLAAAGGGDAGHRRWRSRRLGARDVSRSGAS